MTRPPYFCGFTPRAPMVPANVVPPPLSSGCVLTSQAVTGLGVRLEYSRISRERDRR